MKMKLTGIKSGDDLISNTVTAKTPKIGFKRSFLSRCYGTKFSIVTVWSILDISGDTAYFLYPSYGNLIFKNKKTGNLP